MEKTEGKKLNVNHLPRTTVHTNGLKNVRGNAWGRWWGSVPDECATRVGGNCDVIIVA